MSNKTNSRLHHSREKPYQRAPQITATALQVAKKALPPQDLLRKMFESQTGDWEFVSSSGKILKFHQCVLGEQSDYFEALFSHQDSVECKTKRVAVPLEMDMSGAALGAFLRYLYYKDTFSVTSSCSIMCAIVRASHYYNIPELVQVATEKIQRVSKYSQEAKTWCNVQELWELYQHVWLWEDKHPCKNGLMEAIVNVVKTFAKNKEDHHKLLSLTDGNEILRDFILAIAKTSPFSA